MESMKNFLIHFFKIMIYPMVLQDFCFFLLSLPKDSDFNAEDYKKVKKHDEECKLEDILLELIQFKYVLPFWKESGPVEEYRYIFNDEVSDVEATSKTIHEMIDLGYECIQ